MLGAIIIPLGMSLATLTGLIGQGSIEIAMVTPIVVHHSIISDENMLRMAFAAGFDSENAVTIVCIALAESGGNDDARNWNPPTPDAPNGSLDRGILQINDYYHWEVSDACAYNATCSFREAFRISYGGLEYGAWYAYVYRTHLAFERRVREALARMNDDDWSVDP